jgi:hypothetical protein
MTGLPSVATQRLLKNDLLENAKYSFEILSTSDPAICITFRELKYVYTRLAETAKHPRMM